MCWILSCEPLVQCALAALELDHASIGLRAIQRVDADEPFKSFDLEARPPDLALDALAGKIGGGRWHSLGVQLETSLGTVYHLCAELPSFKAFRRCGGGNGIRARARRLALGRLGAPKPRCGPQVREKMANYFA
jgi:hypothetical protein